MVVIVIKIMSLCITRTRARATGKFDSRGSFGTFPSMMALWFLQYVMTGPFEGPRLRTRRFVFQSSVTTLVHAMDTDPCRYRH